MARHDHVTGGMTDLSCRRLNTVVLCLRSSSALLFGTRLLLIRERLVARSVSVQAEQAFDLKQAWAAFSAVRV